jgi:hypothetical protein
MMECEAYIAIALNRQATPEPPHQQGRASFRSRNRRGGEVTLGNPVDALAILMDRVKDALRSPRESCVPWA